MVMFGKQRDIRVVAMVFGKTDLVVAAGMSFDNLKVTGKRVTAAVVVAARVTVVLEDGTAADFSGSANLRMTQSWWTKERNYRLCLMYGTYFLGGWMFVSREWKNY